jgi:hypothetical protein
MAFSCHIISFIRRVFMSVTIMTHNRRFCNIKKEHICNEFEAFKKYTYTYSENNLLISVLMASDYRLEERYVRYYPNGTLKELYFNSQQRGTEVSFSDTSYYDDAHFENVSRSERNFASSSYTYSYDDEKNPFKGFMIS